MDNDIQYYSYAGNLVPPSGSSMAYAASRRPPAIQSGPPPKPTSASVDRNCYGENVIDSALNVSLVEHYRQRKPPINAHVSSSDGLRIDYDQYASSSSSNYHDMSKKKSVIDGSSLQSTNYKHSSYPGTELSSSVKQYEMSTIYRSGMRDNDNNNKQTYAPSAHEQSYRSFTADTVVKPSTAVSANIQLEKYFSSDEIRRFNEYNRFLVMSSPEQQKKFYDSLTSGEYNRFKDFLEFEAKKPKSVTPITVTISNELEESLYKKNSYSTSYYYNEVEKSYDTEPHSTTDVRRHVSPRAHQDSRRHLTTSPRVPSPKKYQTPAHVPAHSPISTPGAIIPHQPTFAKGQMFYEGNYDVVNNRYPTYEMNQEPESNFVGSSHYIKRSCSRSPQRMNVAYSRHKSRSPPRQSYSERDYGTRSTSAHAKQLPARSSNDGHLPEISRNIIGNREPMHTTTVHRNSSPQKVLNHLKRTLENTERLHKQKIKELEEMKTHPNKEFYEDIHSTVRNIENRLSSLKHRYNNVSNMIKRHESKDSTSNMKSTSSRRTSRSSSVTKRAQDSVKRDLPIKNSSISLKKTPEGKKPNISKPVQKKSIQGDKSTMDSGVTKPSVSKEYRIPKKVLTNENDKRVVDKKMPEAMKSNSSGKNSTPQTKKPVQPKKASQPALEKKAPQSTPVKKASQPVSKKNDSQPAPEKKTPQPAPEKKASQQVQEKKVSQPVPEKKVSQTVSEKKTSQPDPEKKASQSAPEKKAPAPVKKATQPVSAKKPVKKLPPPSQQSIKRSASTSSQSTNTGTIIPEYNSQNLYSKYFLCKVCSLFYETFDDYMKHLHRPNHNSVLRNSDFELIRLAEEKREEQVVLEQAEPLSYDEEFYGTEFLYPSKSFYCDLCATFSNTIKETEHHIRSDKHLKSLKKYLSKNPEYESKLRVRCKTLFKESYIYRKLLRNKRQNDDCNESKRKLMRPFGRTLEQEVSMWLNDVVQRVVSGYWRNNPNDPRELFPRNRSFPLQRNFLTNKDNIVDKSKKNYIQNNVELNKVKSTGETNSVKEKSLINKSSSNQNNSNETSTDKKSKIKIVDNGVASSGGDDNNPPDNNDDDESTMDIIDSTGIELNYTNDTITTPEDDDEDYIVEDDSKHLINSDGNMNVDSKDFDDDVDEDEEEMFDVIDELQ